MAEITAKSRKDDIWDAYQKALKEIEQYENAPPAPVIEESNDLGNKLATYIEAVRKTETTQDRYDAQALWDELVVLVTP